MKTFDQLGLSKTILEGLEDIHFEKTFPIQEAAIPVLLEEHDVIGQAHTGTGKTGAYAFANAPKSCTQTWYPRFGFSPHKGISNSNYH